MKYFVVHICTQTGEREYGEQLVGMARDVTDAKRRTRIDLAETLGNPDEDTWEDDQLDLFDRIVTIEEIREIPAAPRVAACCPPTQQGKGYGTC